jgi:TonB-linked SusC/RagA family outer membrane protein
MADAATYATMLNEINMYAGVALKYKPEDIEKYRNGSDPWRYPNTDWFKEVLRPWSGQNYGNVSLNGGSENMRYFVSLSGKTQEGYYFNSGTKYNQYDFRSNLDGNINRNISISFDVAGRMEDRNFPTRSAGSIFRMVMRGKPNEIAYWPNGLPGPDIEYGDNPVVVSTKATGYDRDKWYVLNTNGKITFRIPWVQGLSVTGNAAIDKSFNFRKVWQTPWYLYSWNGITVDANGIPQLERAQKGFSSPALSQTMQDNQNILLNGLINYETSILANHNLKFLIGAEKITGKGDNFNAYRRNFLSPTLDQLFAGAQDAFMSNTGSGYTQARLNYFGRVNYDYKEKFLAEFVWRYQGSYIFAEKTRFGFFPGISLGYKISEEAFWKDNVTAVSSLKLRASWGRTGNDQIPEFQYLSTYGFGGIRAQTWNAPLPFITNMNQENLTLYETVLPNPNVTWEIANQANIGFDASILNNRISITADYFDYKRSQILWARNASVPTSSGLAGLLPRENIGEVANKGFDFSIGYNNNIGELSFQIGLNGGYQKNKILFWDETGGAPEYQRSTGHPINSGLYYRAIGIFRDSTAVTKVPHMSNARAGDVIFEDINKDGKIDANDRIRIDKSDLPTFTGGLTVNIQYKGFDFALLAQSATGAVRYISTESGEIGNFLQSFAEKRWTPQNPDASGPRTFNRGNEYWVANANTYFLHKTDYIRLKNIELGYKLPASLIGRVGVQSVRVYVNAFNLLTYSPDMKDFDPELGTNSGQGYPLQKIINGGFSVTF